MCGVVGISDCDEAAKLAYLGLYALQHRGQESTGIVVHDENFFRSQRGLGRVNDFFTADRLEYLNWHPYVNTFAIGHNRYSTAGNSPESNVQPLTMETSKGWISLAHNGNLTNVKDLRTWLQKEGAVFRSDSDTEVILHLIRKFVEENSVLHSLEQALLFVEGAYSLLVLSQEGLLAARDPRGFRPLCLGSLGKGHVLASETCALDLIGAEYIREVYPGEILQFSKDTTPKFSMFAPTQKQHPCIFELIYFSRPDSNAFGFNGHLIRKEHGRQLARESYVDADYVIPVPDSGVPASIGYAVESGVPFEMGFIRNHYIGRTFIEPEQSIRNFGVKVKLNPIADLLRGKRVVVVDDSIVRGTTSKKIVHMLRQVGVAEIHMRVSSPPTTHSCFYGIDTPTKEELMASALDIEQMRKYIGADSLAFLSHEGMMKAVGNKTFCSSCFTGKYPV